MHIQDRATHALKEGKRLFSGAWRVRQEGEEAHLLYAGCLVAEYNRVTKRLKLDSHEQFTNTTLSTFKAAVKAFLPEGYSITRRGESFELKHVDLGSIASFGKELTVDVAHPVVVIRQDEHVFA